MKMPQLVGKTVREAQRALPWTTKIVYVDHKAKDAGMILPANWKICKQEPAPGAKSTGRVVLTVIKLTQTCPVQH